jgi:polyphosphate:AMP phosphotransferase
MFERAENADPIDEDVVDQREDDLREELLDAQFSLQEQKRPFVLLVTGVAGSGRGRTMERLLHWMDTRGIHVHASSTAHALDLERPWAWRWWIRLPPSNRIACFMDGWIGELLGQRAAGKLSNKAWRAGLTRIRQWEQHLHDNGVHVVKLWLHLSESQQRDEIKRRLNDPSEHWHVEPADLLASARYEATIAAARELMQDERAVAPWHIVPAQCPNLRTLTVAEHVRDALTEAANAKAPEAGKPDRPEPKKGNVLKKLDLSKSIGKKEYHRELKLWSDRVRLLHRFMQEDGRSAVFAFEGVDAAGKGGSIRRLTAALDPRYYDVHSIAAPTVVEREHLWLWRFWQRVPRRGRIAIFDRSWYGRVLVERVEGFAAEDDWRRAYQEIRDFESQLTESRVLVVKFWLHISEGEQLARFEARQDVDHKRYKLTDEDWRNREKAPFYEAAACDMVAETDIPAAPWHLIAAESKHAARVQVVKRACKEMARVLEIDIDSLPE